MDENQTTQGLDFSEFYEADGGDAGNQTDDPAKTEEDTGNEGSESPSDTEDYGKSGDEGTEAPEEQNDEDSPDEPPKPDPQGQEETFTIKVNKEARTVSREEVITLAQKGADYDRVKQQLAEIRQEAETLRTNAAQHREVLDLLDLVCQRTKSTPETLIEGMYLSLQKANGVGESAAREALRADRLQKKLNDMETRHLQKKSADDDQATRAAREVAEFRQQFPDVEMDEPLLKLLMPDVQSGMSLTNAYRKAESTKKDAEIAELQRKLAAAEQNRKNRKSSPGSQNDSGGSKKKDPFADFYDAFE